MEAWLTLDGKPAGARGYSPPELGGSEKKQNFRFQYKGGEFLIFASRFQ